MRGAPKVGMDVVLKSDPSVKMIAVKVTTKSGEESPLVKTNWFDSNKTLQTAEFSADVLEKAPEPVDASKSAKKSTKK